MPQEDEIDLKDLIRTLLRNKKTIFLITVLVTILAVVYSLLKTPIYEVKSVISIGEYEGKLIESPQTLITRNSIVYIDNASKEEITSLEKITLKKGTSNLIEFVVQSDTNENGIKKLDSILQEIFALHEKKINKYKNYNIQQINVIKSKINQYKSEKVNIKNNNELVSNIDNNIFSLENKISALELKNSDMMIEKSAKIGSYIINENPIAPKKKLIVIVAFVTGFIFSIFFVFLRDFIVNFEDDLKEADEGN
jgi:uncharacterized protein involved in exopolysaccharide biosynthesis